MYMWRSLKDQPWRIIRLFDLFKEGIVLPVEKMLRITIGHHHHDLGLDVI